MESYSRGRICDHNNVMERDPTYALIGHLFDKHIPLVDDATLPNFINKGTNPKIKYKRRGPRVQKTLFQLRCGILRTQSPDSNSTTNYL